MVTGSRAFKGAPLPVTKSPESAADFHGGINSILHSSPVERVASVLCSRQLRQQRHPAPRVCQLFSWANVGEAHRRSVADRVPPFVIYCLSHEIFVDKIPRF